MFFSELLLSLGKLLFTTLLPFLLGRDLLVALITFLLDESFSADDVTFTVLNGEEQPAEKTTRDQIELVDGVLVDSFDQLLDVVDGLILLKVALLGTHGLVRLHLVEEHIIDEQFGSLPEKLLSALFDDTVPLVAEEVQQSLHELAVLDDLDFF